MKDHWGTSFNKPFRLFQWRYNVGVDPTYNGKGETYYRPFWTGLRCWWEYRRCLGGAI